MNQMKYTLKNRIKLNQKIKREDEELLKKVLGNNKNYFKIRTNMNQNIFYF